MAINDFLKQSPLELAEWLYDRYRYHAGPGEVPFYALSDEAQLVLIELAKDLHTRDAQLMEAFAKALLVDSEESHD